MGHAWKDLFRTVVTRGRTVAVAVGVVGGFAPRTCGNLVETISGTFNQPCRVDRATAALYEASAREELKNGNFAVAHERAVSIAAALCVPDEASPPDDLGEP